MGTLVRHFRSLQRNGRLYLISNAIQAASAGAIGVLYTLYLSTLGFGTNFIGLVLFFGVLGAGAALIPAAPLVRALGWRAMLLWSDWVGGLAIVLQLLIPVPIVIFLTTFVAGASFAIVLIINTPLLTAYSPSESRTAVFGLNSALGLLAAVVGTELGGLLPGFFRLDAVAHAGVIQAMSGLLAANPQARAYQLSMLVMGVTAVPSIVPIYLMREDEHGRRASRRARADALGGEEPRAALLPPGEPRLGAVLGRVRTLRMWLGAQARRLPGCFDGVIGRFSLTQGLLGFGAGLYLQYLNIYFVKDLHQSTAFYGTLAAVVMIVQAVTAVLSAPYAARMGQVRGSAVALLCSLPFLFLLGLGPTLLIISGAFLVRGALTSMAGPPLQTFLMEAVPEEARVVASEAFNVSFQIAGALGLVIGGQLIASLGFRLTFDVAAVFYVLCAVLLLVWFVRRPPSAKKLPPADPATGEPIEPLASGGARQ